MLIKLIYYIGIILSESDPIEVEDYIRIIADSNFKEIVGQNGSNLTDYIELIYEEKNERYGKILWDKYFIRPFFYRIKLKDFKSSKNNISFITKCISNRKEVIYKFKINHDSQKTTISDFYGSNNSKLNVRKINNNTKTYVLFQNDENYEALKNCFKYMKIYKLTDVPCSSLLIRFFNLFENLKELERYAKDFNCESLLNKTKEIKMIALKAANSMAKIYISLKFPGLDKDKFIKPYKDYEQYISQISIKSCNIVNLFEKSCTKRDKSQRDDDYKSLQSFKLSVEHLKLQEEDFWQYRRDKGISILNINSKVSFRTVYDRVIENIRKIDNLKKESERKGAFDIQLVFSHNLDHFYETYSSSLLEYCEIMRTSNEIYLVDYCLNEKLDNNKDCFSMIKEINFDILAAEEMEKDLLAYQNDKTDFSIFSQTEYFRNEMLDRILENLDNFILCFELNEKNGDVEGNELDGLLEENKTKLNRMKTLRIQWTNFKDLYNSFNDFLDKTTARVIQNDTINSNGIIDKSNAEEKQELNNLDENDKILNQNKIQGIDHSEESKSGSEEVRTTENKESKDKLEHNEVQKSTNKEFVPLKEEVNASDNKKKLDENNNEVKSETVSDHQPGKTNKINDKSKPVENQQIKKTNENHKINVQKNKLNPRKSNSLHYYLIAIAFFSILTFGIIYFIIVKYRNRVNH